MLSNPHLANNLDTSECPMAFCIRPGMRLLCGHIAPGHEVGLRREARHDGGDNYTGQRVNNGEGVAVISVDNQFALVARADGVKGWVNMRHLHVQAWPSATRCSRRHGPTPLSS